MPVETRYERIKLLPEMVRTEKESVEQHRCATRANEAALREEWKNVDVVVKSFEQLETLAKKHRMGDQAKIDTTNAKHLAVKCKTLVLKVRSVELTALDILLQIEIVGIRRCLELEILASTYKPETVQALKKIRTYLDKNLARVRAEVDQSKTSLMQYEAVGEEFDAIVSEYAKIKAEIEGKKWAIKELKKDS